MGSLALLLHMLRRQGRLRVMLEGEGVGPLGQGGYCPNAT
jgi:hypothetical protein